MLSTETWLLNGCKRKFCVLPIASENFPKSSISCIPSSIYCRAKDAKYEFFLHAKYLFNLNSNKNFAYYIIMMHIGNIMMNHESYILLNVLIITLSCKCRYIYWRLPPRLSSLGSPRQRWPSRIKIPDTLLHPSIIHNEMHQSWRIWHKLPCQWKMLGYQNVYLDSLDPLIFIFLNWHLWSIQQLYLHH